MDNHIIKKIRSKIENTKYENCVFVAGGFVRDYIMNRNSKDIDLAVANHGINGGIEFANYLYKTLGLDHSPVVFERFGTARIIINGEQIEIVAARKESYGFKSRKPTVESGTLEDEVMRRDFTINALLWDISNNKLIDLVDSVDDIKNRIIKTTNNPDIIFAEDQLRIMRAIRFSAQLGFDIEIETWTAIVKYVPWLNNISNERIRDEFNKILVAEHFVRGIDDLYRSGILAYMIKEFSKAPSITNQGKFHTKDLINHTFEVMIKSPANVEHRLAALLHDIGKVNTMTVENGEVHFYQHQFHSQRIAKNFMIRYKYTNEQIEWVTNSIGMHMNFVDRMLDKTIRKMVNQYGKEQFLFFTDLGLADSKRPERKAVVQSIIDFVNTDNYVPEQVMKMPVNGDMIMERFGLKPGKEVGRLLAIEKEYLFEFPEATIEDIWEVISNNR